MKRILIATLVLVGLLGCAKTAGHVNYAVSISATDRPESRLEAVAQGSNRFACDLYRELSPMKGNLCVSPFSVAVVLAMVAEGAQGQTADELRKALGLSDIPAAEISEGYRELLAALVPGRRSEGTAWTLANRLYGLDGYRFNRNFVAELEADFASTLVPADFASDPQGARRQINRWVESATKRKIRELLPANAVNRLSVLVLVNALLLRAQWADPFREGLTAKRPFRTPDGPVSPPTMNKTDSLKYASTREARLVDLHYRGGELAMTLILPRKGKSLETLQKRFTAQKFSGWIAKLHSERVRLTLPRFAVHRQYDLIEPLSKLGIRSLFEPLSSDLSGISMDDPLYVSLVAHQGYTSIDEKGTEAAAATASGTKFGFSSDAKPIAFHVDQPFLFVIRHRATGTILFIGRIVDPTS